MESKSTQVPAGSNCINVIMTSVNEMNAYKRGKEEGTQAGYDIGHNAGYSKANEWHLKEKTTLRLYRYAICMVIGFMIAVVLY